VFSVFPGYALRCYGAPMTGERVNPDAELAPYLQLAAILRGQIERGELAPGARLPSIIDLAARYGVARTTAHKSLRVLVDSGLAVVSPGRGMYVRRKLGGTLTLMSPDSR
jgi:GntR family transcriptional regulator